MWILCFLITGIILWIICEILLDNQKNTYNVTWATELLEKAVMFAMTHTESVEIFFEKSKEIEGGYIIRIEHLQLSESVPRKKSLAESPIQWDICIQNEDGTITLRYESGCGYTGPWKHFQRAVMQQIKKQHPHWKTGDNIIRV